MRSYYRWPAVWWLVWNELVSWGSALRCPPCANHRSYRSHPWSLTERQAAIWTACMRVDEYSLPPGRSWTSSWSITVPQSTKAHEELCWLTAAIHVQEQELELIILVGPIQLRTLYNDSVTYTIAEPRVPYTVRMEKPAMPLSKQSLCFH